MELNSILAFGLRKAIGAKEPLFGHPLPNIVLFRRDDTYDWSD